MSSSRDVRFVHLADLHMTPCPTGGRCGPYEVACRACIKRGILGRLREVLASGTSRPDLLLISGDLTERRDSDVGLRATTAPVTELVESARAAGTAVIGVTGEHDGPDSTGALRRSLGWSWLLRSGEVRREAGVAVYGIEGRAKCAGIGEEFAAIIPNDPEPAIVVAHGELSALKSETPRFAYLAMGTATRCELGSVRREPLSLHIRGTCSPTGTETARPGRFA